MKTPLGQTVIVEDRPGPSAMIAANVVAKSPPDGLSLLMAASGEVAINQHLYKDKMTYDPLRELAPVALIGIVPCVVVVGANIPVHNAAELIAYARANRGKLSFSSSGVGNPQQLAGALMHSMAAPAMPAGPAGGADPAGRPASCRRRTTRLLSCRRRRSSARSCSRPTSGSRTREGAL